MVNCSKCGKDLYMPFTCKYCGNQFCSEHRLPESHNCVGIKLKEEEEHPRASNIPEGAEVVEEEYIPETGERVVRYFVPTVRRPGKPLFRYSSGTELKHLFIGILLMFESVFLMFVISFYQSNLLRYQKIYILIAILGSLITIGFIGHELSHKFASIRLDFWAEFRLEKTYAIITALFPYFVMPGAVQVGSSRAGEKEMGKIALAGPLFNLLLGSIYLSIGLLFNYIIYPNSNDVTWWIMGFSAFMNVMLGIFNLIPLSVLDGKKVIHWNKFAWISTLIALIGLVIALVFIPWSGAYARPAEILTTVPEILYKSDFDLFLERIAPYIHPFLPYLL